MTHQPASVLRCLLVAMLSIVMGAACVLAGPAIFAELKLDEAIERSKAEGRILVVKGTAEWCGPCKQMDRTAWVDPKIEAWFGEKGLAIAVDVDAEPATAKRLKIRAMPTMIAFKDGAEVDRIVGGRSAGQLLEWLEGVEEGRTSIDEARAAAGDRGGEGVDIRKRLDLARELLETGRHGEALDEYVWLWSHMVEHDPGYVGVRVSFMTSEMGELARQHKPARDRFVELRDAIEARLRSGDATMNDLTDWGALTIDALGEPERVIAWYERVKDDPEAAPSLRWMSLRLKRALIEQERYADAGGLMESPAAEVRALLGQRKLLLGMVEADAHEAVAGSMREQVVVVYACALAAGRNVEGEQIVELLLSDDDSAESRAALVERALRAGQPRESHRALLEAAQAKGAEVGELRAQLERALEAKK